jgi:hypothetical protein
MQCLHPIFVQVQVLALANARSVSPAASYLKIGGRTSPKQPSVLAPGLALVPRVPAHTAIVRIAARTVVASGVSHRVRVQPQSCVRF